MVADPPLPIRVLVRTDIDWTAMTRADFVAQTHRDRPHLFLANVGREEVLDLWDRLYRIDLFTFRRELQQLALRHLRDVVDAELTIGLDGFKRWLGSEQDEWIFPIDDDDWFRPNLAQIVEHARPDTGVLIWPQLQYRYDADERPVLDGFLPIAHLGSCNWAVRKHWLRDRFNPSQVRKILAIHNDAHRHLRIHFDVPPAPAGQPWFTAVLDVPEVQNLVTGHWSLSVRHHGSLQHLSEVVRREDPEAALRARDLTNRCAVDEVHSWAEPSIRELESLLGSMAR